MKPETLRLLLAGGAFAVLALVFAWQEIPSRQERALAAYPSDVAGAPDVKVAFLARPEGVRVSVTGGFELLGDSGRRIPHENRSLAPVLVRRSGGGLAVGDERLRDSELEFRPVGSGWAASEVRVDGVAVPGSVIVTGVSREDASPALAEGRHGAAAVARMDVESYVCAALAAAPGAAGGDWRSRSDQALAAEAVCLRTFALYRRAVSRGERGRGGEGPRGGPEWDFEDARLLETLRSGSHRSARIALAVNRTRARVLTWDRRLFPAHVTRSCGGATEDASNVFTASSITPLSGVECPHCSGLQGAEIEWKARLSTRRITERLRPAVEGPVVYKLGRIKRVEAASTGTSGRATVLRIEAAFGPFEMPVEGFRAALGEGVLPSAPARIRDAGPETIEFAGRGRGPGVGLCRLGAEQMSREGEPCAEILRRYFPGSRLARLPYQGRRVAEEGRPAPRRRRGP